jgi:hypothetical protein
MFQRSAGDIPHKCLAAALNASLAIPMRAQQYSYIVMTFLTSLQLCEPTYGGACTNVSLPQIYCV